MISMFRTTALAAALAAASLGVTAATVTLDLTALGNQALGSNPPATGAPVPVGQIQGFSFSSNAFVYDPGMLQSGVDLQAPANTSGPFIMNGDRNTASFSGIEISLGSGFLANGQFFESVAMSLFSRGNVVVSWYKKGNATSTADGQIGLSNPTTGEWNPWAKGTNWDAVEQIDRISFSAGSGAYFGIQGLRIGLTAGTDPNPNPNPAPEPASYALVGLALLAAGAASRRRA